MAKDVTQFNNRYAISDIQSDNTHLRTPSLVKRLLQPVTAKGVPECAGFHAIVSFKCVFSPFQ
jgi:hypothetical protein